MSTQNCPGEQLSAESDKCLSMHIFLICVRLFTEIPETELTLKEADKLCVNQVLKVTYRIGFGTKLHHLASRCLRTGFALGSTRC